MTSIFLDISFLAYSLSLGRRIESLKIDTVESDFYVRVSLYISTCFLCIFHIFVPVYVNTWNGYKTHKN